MNTELLEIRPQELTFIFEFNKRSSCSVRLFNKSDHHVAFKIKTTSSEKYCVKPNTGVIKPNLTCDFTVTMQAQNVAPPDFICKDRFLIQSTIVPKGTTEEHITSTMFSKEYDKHIEENKLKVILVSPPHSPVLSPMNGISRTRPYDAATESQDDLVQMGGSDGNGSRQVQVDEDIEVKLSNDVEEMKSKLREFESILRQDNLRNKQNTRTREIGFQLLFVFVVAIASLYLGYLLHS